MNRLNWKYPYAEGRGAVIMYTLIQTCRLNDVDPQAWLADVLARIADHPLSRLDELLPWNWRPKSTPRRLIRSLRRMDTRIRTVLREQGTPRALQA